MSLNQKKLERILDGCRAGSKVAQQALYYQFYSYALTVGLHYSKNKEEAEEIVHDAFLKVFAKMKQFSGQGNFKAWFRRVLINVAIDYSRKNSKKWDISKVAPAEASVKNEALPQLELEDIWVLLQKLPPSYRMVFNLHVLEGFTHREIADKLGISIGTSKSNLARAKSKLQSLVQAYIKKNNPPTLNTFNHG